MTIKTIATLLTCFALMACSQDESNVSVSVTSSPLPLIPAPAASCLAQITARQGGTSPTSDISASYFRVPVITFSRKDASKNLFIAFIRINIQIPGTSTPVNCEYGGDALAALDETNWYNSSTKEAKIPAGSATWDTKCPLYCGGITMPNPTVATGTLQVFGYEETNDTNKDQTPVNIETSVSIQGF